MKILYECEICGFTSENRAEVEQCEARGRERAYPVGMIYGNASREGASRGVTYAVAVNDCWIKHRWSPASWACQDNGLGDLVGDKMVGTLPRLESPDPRHPTFRRMVAFLKRHNIPITVYDEQSREAIPLDVFLSRAGVKLGKLPPYTPPPQRFGNKLRCNPDVLHPDVLRCLGRTPASAASASPDPASAEGSTPSLSSGSHESRRLASDSHSGQTGSGGRTPAR